MEKLLEQIKENDTLNYEIIKLNNEYNYCILYAGNKFYYIQENYFKINTKDRKRLIVG